MLKPRIGAKAKEVWEFLGEYGETPITQLPKKLKTTNPELIHQAVGWLARENKIDYIEKKDGTFVNLTDGERSIHGRGCCEKKSR